MSVESFGGHPYGPMLYGCTVCGLVYIYGPKAEACCKKPRLHDCSATGCDYQGGAPCRIKEVARGR
jgi:hypothetical protein